MSPAAPLRLIALAFVGIALAGCNGGAAALLGCPSTKVSNNGVPELLYPEGGARNVGDSLGSVIIAFNGTASEVDTLSLSGGAKGPVAIGPVKVAPTTLPSPRAPTPTGWSVYAVTLPPLSGATTYTLKYTYTSSYNSCNGQQASTSTLGQFTTN